MGLEPTPAPWKRPTSPGRELELSPFVMRRIAIAALMTMLVPLPLLSPQRLSAAQEPSFKAGVELVTVFAVVRDRRGRPAPSLTARDFNVVDEGRPRSIVECRIEEGPITVAILADVSGSMAVSARLSAVRDATRQLLSWLVDGEDQVALFSFDDRLHQVQAFTTAHADVSSRLDSLKAFGSTSLYDAIWQVGTELAAQTGMRSAVIAITDGQDTRSRLSARETAQVVRLVDVPVYFIAIDPVRGSSSESGEQPLLDLAQATGGEYFAAGGPAQTSMAVRQIVSELRHRYLIAFEPSAPAGWHSLAVRTVDQDLVVRARSGYLAGLPRQH